LKTKSKTQQDICTLSVTRHAFLTSFKIAANSKGSDNIWVCAPNGNNSVRFFKFGGLSASIKGTAPKSCDNMAATTNTELYVVSEKKIFFLSRNSDQQSFTWSEVSGVVNPVDVAVDNTNRAFFIDSAGTIFNLNGLRAGNKYFDKKYGENCRIESKFSSENGFYLIKNDKLLYDINDKGEESLISDIGFDDLCVDLNAGLYLTGFNGIYLMKSRVKFPVKVTNDIATSISCGQLLWFIGADGFVYQGTRK
jgi:hypothetical protein